MLLNGDIPILWIDQTALGAAGQLLRQNCGGWALDAEPQLKISILGVWHCIVRYCLFTYIYIHTGIQWYVYIKEYKVHIYIYVLYN